MPPAPSSAPGATGAAPALRLAALAALALWALWTWAGAQGVWANDLAALWFAGHFAATGQEALIYAAPPEFFGGTPAEWEPLRASLGAAPQELAFPYVYPPLWAGLIAPLTGHVGPRAFFDAALALQIAMLAASVPLAAQIARPPRLAAPLFTLWGIAVLGLTTASTAAVVLNQPSITIGFLVLLAFALLPRAPRSAGAVLALAAALKLTPAVFVLLLLRRSTRPALAAFLLTGAALALASVALMGWPLHRAFLEQLARAAQSTVWAPMNPSPRALATAGAAALGLAPPIPYENALLAILTPPAWIGRLAALSAAALALLTLRLATRAPEREGTALALLAVEIILFLLGPLSWLHYLIAPLLLLPALGLGLPRRLTLPMLGLALGLGSNLCLALVMRGPAPLLSYSLLTVALWAGLLALALLALARVARGR